MKEKELEQKCCKYARNKGFAAVKLEKNGNKGIPDVVIIGKCGVCLFVEFKNPNGRGVISDEQKFWAKYLGYSHVFISDFEAFCKIVDLYFMEGLV